MFITKVRVIKEFNEVIKFLANFKHAYHTKLEIASPESKNNTLIYSVSLSSRMQDFMMMISSQYVQTLQTNNLTLASIRSRKSFYFI